jgi:hypothetical protein
MPYRLLPRHAAAPSDGRPAAQGQAADTPVTHNPTRAGKSGRRRQGKHTASVGTREAAGATRVYRFSRQSSQTTTAPRSRPSWTRRTRHRWSWPTSWASRTQGCVLTRSGSRCAQGQDPPRADPGTGLHAWPHHRHGSGADQYLNQAGDTPARGDVQPRGDHQTSIHRRSRSPASTVWASARELTWSTPPSPPSPAAAHRAVKTASRRTTTHHSVRAASPSPDPGYLPAPRRRSDCTASTCAEAASQTVAGARVTVS